MYERGDYAAVARQLDTVKDPHLIDRLDAELKDHAKTWIDAADPPARRRRAFVAGSLALELMHALVERDTWEHDVYPDDSVES